jgi:NDP-sugar pyrophosphorylase family protein
MDAKKYIESCQLVVHAGGMGERWSPVTNGEIVKPRTEVGAKPRPMIDWAILPFVKAGIKNIFPTLWFKSETLTSHLDKMAKETGLKFTYLIEPENKRLGRAGIIKESIKTGKLDAKRPIISINGSDVLAVDVEDLIKFHLEGVAEGIGVTVIGASEIPTEFGLYEVDPKTKRVLGFKEKPVVNIAPKENVHTGIFIFDPSANFAFMNVDEKSYPINIEDLKGKASESIFKNARSYGRIIPFKQWVFFKSPKHFKEYGKTDFEKFLNVKNADAYLGKYENGN